MQQPGSQSQASAKQRKSSVMIAGVGAALVACAVTFVMLARNPAPPVPEQAATASEPHCNVVRREFLVSTTSGSGTVRLREGSYLSPPITLSTTPQRVVFPLARPETMALANEEVITIEGNATDVVLTSPLTSYRRVFDNVTGVVAFSTKWMPARKC